MSLQKKLMMILIGFTLLPMTVVGTWGYMQFRQILLTNQMASVKNLADLNARRLEDFFVDLKKDIQTLAHHPDIYTPAALLISSSQPPAAAPPSEKIKAVLDNLLRAKRRVSQYLNVMLLDSKGRLIYTLNQTDGVQRLVSLLLSDTDKIFSALDVGLYMSEVVTADATEGPFFLFMMAPVIDPTGEPTGIIVFEIPMAPIYEIILETTGLGRTGEIIIMAKSADALLFFSPSRHALPKTVRPSELFRSHGKLPILKALDGSDGQGATIDYRNQEVFAAWRHLAFAKWGLVTKINLAEATASANKLGKIVLTVILLTAIVGAIVVLQVSKSILRPIRNLQDGASIIGRGDLDYKVGTPADDEIGQLSRAFDRMTTNLKTITASRNELEREIEKRRSAESGLRNSMLTLDKRIRELDCLYNLSRLVEIQGSSAQPLLKGTIDLIPQAFQQPHLICVRIAFDNMDARTPNFQKTPWRAEETIHVAEQNRGFLVVGYLAPPSDERFPFTPEEAKLIHALAERLGSILERQQAERALILSEQRFRTLVEHSLTAISIIQDNRVVYQNPEQDKLLGPLPRPIIFKNHNRLHPDDAPVVIRAFHDLESGKEVTLDTNFRIFDRDRQGKTRQVKYLHGRISRIEFKGKAALLVNLVNLTEVKNLEKLLIVQDKMASLGRVAAGIAHEIRNPLSGINIYANTLEKLIERQAPPEKLKTVFKPIQSASAKIESVIKRVMDFAKPTEPALVLTDIRKPIDEALKLASVALRKKDIRAELLLPADLPPCKVDPHLFEEIFLNFINNASDAMKGQSGDKILRIQVKTEGDIMEVRFGDSGPGVPVHLREDIFDPFFTTKPDSTGIGLSLCHRIISDHGGRLHVESSALGGAEFVIRLPFRHKGTDA